MGPNSSLATCPNSTERRIVIKTGLLKQTCLEKICEEAGVKDPFFEGIIFNQTYVIRVNFFFLLTTPPDLHVFNVAASRVASPESAFLII